MAEQTHPLAGFLALLQAAAGHQELSRLTLSKSRRRSNDLRNVFVKLVTLKKGDQLSFVYRHTTRDITRNFDIDAGILETERLLKEDFLLADLFTASADYHLVQYPGGKAKMRRTPSTQPAAAGVQPHDQQKQRLLSPGNRPYLHLLGITTADGKVKNDRQDKYRQINHYVEIIRGQLKNDGSIKKIRVTDMGSGKGYLSFALYDFLTQTLGWEVEMEGIEMRPELVDTCNRIAAASGFSGLRFVQGNIVDATLPATDLLIALHACDTATDEAIFKGIQAGAQWILTAPCCHKQVRRQMHPDNILSAVTRHGILLERQAEIVTDSIRALLMEAAGYKTSVFDFIATEHTPKNVMIAGIKQTKPAAGHREDCFRKVNELKALFGIREQRLQQLLEQ